MTLAGGTVWLLPKSVVRAVTYYVPVDLNSPETLRPPVIKAVPSNTYLSASTLGSHSPLRAVLLPVLATITILTEAVIVRSYGNLSIYWTFGTIDVTHADSKAYVRVEAATLRNTYILPEITPAVSVEWLNEGMTLMTDLSSTTIPIGLPKPGVIYIEGNATAITLTP